VSDVLFICVANSGRSVLAERIFESLAGGRHHARSAGSEPGQAPHPVVVEALREIGLDASDHVPRRLDPADVSRADVVVSTCGEEACPVTPPGTRRISWNLPDPKGLPLEAVRELRDEIRRRVIGLIAELDDTPDGTYWVEPGRLLAGPYPDDAGAFAGAGVTATVDLTCEDEGWPDYWTATPGLEHRRVELRDFAAPSEWQMRCALGEIDELLRAGRVVYVHCRGGRGRTGSVVACYLIEQGANADEALATVRERSGSPSSPETDEQRSMVRAWRRAPAAAAANARPPGSSSDA
jgi:arsenate reductase (thioredoxin)